jgi:hypothetical protein
MKAFKIIALICLPLLILGCGDDDNGCTPDCDGKVCGDDGCGGTCAPGCGTGETCNAQGLCDACQPDCAGKVCGDDGCGGQCQPGCGAGQTCNAQGQCEGGGDANPTSGTWLYSEYTASTNDCNSDDLISNGAGTFTLTNNGDSTFTVTPTDGTDPFDCTITGSAFNCPTRAMVDVDMNPTFDAHITATATVTGTFADDTHMSGTQNGTADCSGTACAAAATFLQTTFPCNYTISFGASYQ